MYQFYPMSSYVKVWSCLEVTITLSLEHYSTSTVQKFPDLTRHCHCHHHRTGYLPSEVVHFQSHLFRLHTVCSRQVSWWNQCRCSQREDSTKHQDTAGCSDHFECNQTGQTAYQIKHTYRINSIWHDFAVCISLRLVSELHVQTLYMGLVSKERYNERATNRKQFQKSDTNIADFGCHSELKFVFLMTKLIIILTLNDLHNASLNSN